VTTAAFILAEGIGDFGEVLFIIVVVVLALIGKLFQKNTEERQAEKDEQQAREDRETLAQRRREAAAERPEPPAVRLAAEPPAPPATPAEARQVPATRRTKEQAVEARQLQELETAHVGEALAARRIKGARVSSRRRPGRLGAGGGTTTSDAVRAMLTVDLSGRSRARQAILYHEIFSSPKGLRSDKELWDR